MTDLQNRVDECRKEIDEVLHKHKCRLVPRYSMIPIAVGTVQFATIDGSSIRMVVTPENDQPSVSE